MIHGETNKLLPLVASCVRLSHGKDSKGRCLQATADISVGTVLLSEPAFAAVVSTDCDTSRCHHCFVYRAVDDLIVCGNCGWIRFCSAECQSKANELYHWLECKHADLIRQAAEWDRTIVLVIRILLAAQPYELVKSRKSCEDKTQIPGCDSIGCFRGDYWSVYSLMTHEARQPELAPQYQKIVHQLAGALANDILHGRKHRDIHDTDTEVSECSMVLERFSLSDSSSGRDLVEKLFLHHLMQLRCNLHAITDITSKDESISGAKSETCGGVESQRQVRLAMAIFPTASLLNHSCDPNTIVSYEGRQITIRAMKAICEGEEISHCYGPHAKHMPTEERQALLRAQYFFDCDCPACRNNSTVDDVLPDAFKCRHCSELLKGLSSGKAYCTRCKTSFDMVTSLQELKQALHLYNISVDLMETGRHEEALKSCRKALKIRRRLLHVSSKTLGQTHDSTAEVYALLGNFAKAAWHCDASCKTVEAFYGSDSIELANELFKLSQLQFNARKAAEVLDTIHRALRLLCLYYGDNDDRVVELQQMRAFVVSQPPH